MNNITKLMLHDICVDLTFYMKAILNRGCIICKSSHDINKLNEIKKDRQKHMKMLREVLEREAREELQDFNINTSSFLNFKFAH